MSNDSNNEDNDEEEADLVCPNYETAKEHFILCLDVFSQIKENDTELLELRTHIYSYCFTKYLIDIMCNIKEILDRLNSKDEVDVINYIYILFNDDLYKECLKLLNEKNKYKLLFYGILLVEYWKQSLVLQYSNTLVADCTNPKEIVRNKIVETQCSKCLDISKKLVKEYYELAKNHSKVSKKELNSCKKIIELIDDKYKYEIEIIVEK